LDDILIINSSRIGLIKDLEVVRSTLEQLGFVISKEKSVTSPTQLLEYLGLMIDSVNMSFSLPPKKIDKILSQCRSLLKAQLVSLRDLASFLGSLNWASFAISRSQAHIRSIQSDYITGSKRFGGDLTQRIPLSVGARGDLNWWAANVVASNGRPLFDPEPSLVIYSDASLSGWGASCGNVSTGGLWTVNHLNWHINDLELQAAFYALKCFAADLYDCSVLLRMDNTTAISYINRFGGSRSSSLCKIAIEITSWCEARNICLQATHIPGILNSIADRESRARMDWSEWMLSRAAFDSVMAVWPMKIDLFASAWNAQLPEFVSWLPQPNAIGTDALSIPWSGLKGYAFPPFCLIKDCLSKIIRERAELVLICPFWPAQPWFPLILSLAMDVPLILSQRSDLLTDNMGVPHQLCLLPSFRLVAWMLSGTASKTRAFRMKWSTYSWPASALRRFPLTSQPGECGVIGISSGIPIPCRAI